MGGHGQDNPLQGLCQGIGATPACWLMLSSVLMNCYKHQGFGSRFISLIRRLVIDSLREIYINDMDLIITRSEMMAPLDTQLGLRDAAGARVLYLNASSGAISPKKSRWIFVGYTWINGWWQYAPQLNLPMTIPLLDGLEVDISQGGVSTVEKALGVWPTVDGNNHKHLEEKITWRLEKWIS